MFPPTEQRRGVSKGSLRGFQNNQSGGLGSQIVTGNNILPAWRTTETENLNTLRQDVPKLNYT